MQIFSAFQITNRNCFIDSGRISLGQFMTVVVGANSAGKSTLLELLLNADAGRPHFSPKLDGKLNNSVQVLFGPLPSTEVTAVVENQKAVSADVLVPNPARATFIDDQISEALDTDQLEWAVGRINNSANFTDRLTTPMLVFDNAHLSGYSFHLHRHITSHRIAEYVNADIQVVPINTLLPVVHQASRFRFVAERYGIGLSDVSSQSELKSDSSNLASVLHNLLTTNPTRFSKFMDGVQRVLPNVQRITTPPVGTGQVEVRIWEHEPDSDEDRFARSLDEMGSGVGQVLGLLYVCYELRNPCFILIDEPQNFLHPGAIRALFEEFRLSGSQHQFVVTTHSPLLIDAAHPDMILRLYKEDYETKIQQIDKRDLQALRSVLDDLGSSLADVFGAEAILWVEGQTEELAYPLIIEKVLGKPLGQRKILGVVDTGKLTIADSALTLQLYRRLSSSGLGLLPPAIGILFDREARSDKLLEDLKRQALTYNVRMEFLTVKMFEEYLLSPLAIAALINELIEGIGPEWEGERPATVTDTDVQSLLVTYSTLDASKQIEEVFKASFGSRLSYDKVAYGVMLTEKVIEVEPHILEPVVRLLDSMLFGQDG